MRGTGWTVAICAWALWLGGCAASAPVDRYYVLDAAPSARAPADAGFAGDLNLRVTRIPSSADRAQIVVQRGPNELTVRDQDRWAEPLRGGLERCLVQDLRRALPGAWISSEGLHRDAEPLRVNVDFTVLEALPDGTVHLRADWAIGAGQGAARRTHSLDLSRSGIAPATAAIVAAWSDELDELAQAIARSVAGPPAR
jgi:uncharacterized lipoprotein YmbA